MNGRDRDERENKQHGRDRDERDNESYTRFISEREGERYTGPQGDARKISTAWLRRDGSCQVAVVRSCVVMILRRSLHLPRRIAIASKVSVNTLVWVMKK